MRPSPSVPDRTWFDPVLDCYLHTGENAREQARAVPSGHIAMDIETPGLDDAFTINCVTASWEHQGQTHCVLLDPARRGEDHALVCLIVLRATMLIFHNAPFDVPALHHVGVLDLPDISRIVDTLVLARFGFPDVMQRKTLAALAKAHLGMDDNAEGMKLAMRAAGYRTIDEGYRHMDIGSPIYRQGAMLDTLATLRLQPILREHCWAWTLDHPFTDHGATTHGEAEAILERQEQVHRVMLRRTAVGLAVDREYLTTYAEQIDQQRLLATAELATHGLEGGAGKGAALVNYLHAQGELPDGWPRTRTRKLSATKADLERLDHPLAQAQRTLAYSDKIMGYLEKVYHQAEVTGRCHPQVGVLGASATGRMSYSSPEMQQFPKEARPIIADDGQGLTSIDWAQIEPVTMALMARDEGFLAPFEAGEDLYEPIQRSCGLSMDKSGRDLAKIVLLATMYGQGVRSLAARIGHTEESAAQIRRQMIAAMPRCGKWMRQIESISDQYGIIPTAAGRILPVDKGYGYKAVNYCLSPETLILRADLTHVAAHAISVGDELVGFDEFPLTEPGNTNKYRHLRTSTVEAVSTVIKPSMLVYTEDGQLTVCSADHLWLVRRNRYLRWKRADQLEAHDELLSLGRWRTDSSRTVGYLAGLLDGEGSLTRNVTGSGQRKSCQITFSQNSGPVMGTYLKAMAELGLPAHLRLNGATDTSPCDHAITSGVRTVMRLIGTMRPERFIARAKSIYEGRAITAGLTDTVRVAAVQPIGDQELTSIQTSTRTLIANGYLSHNCVQGSAYDVLAHTICEMDRQGIGDEVILAMHDELVVSTPVAEQVQQIMTVAPPFLERWAGRSIALRTDRADMESAWAKV